MIRVSIAVQAPRITAKTTCRSSAMAIACLQVTLRTWLSPIRSTWSMQPAQDCQKVRQSRQHTTANNTSVQVFARVGTRRHPVLSLCSVRYVCVCVCVPPPLSFSRPHPSHYVMRCAPYSVADVPVILMPAQRLRRSCCRLHVLWPHCFRCSEEDRHPATRRAGRSDPRVGRPRAARRWAGP